MEEKTTQKGSLGWLFFICSWSILLYIFLGIICFISIIGIPCGIKYFKMIKILFLSPDKTVVNRPDNKKRALSVYWGLYGGYELRLIYFIATQIFKSIKSGTSIALKIDRMYAFIKNPFGAEIVDYGKYTHSRNTMYDYTLLQRKICKNPDVRIFDDMRGRPVTVKKYLQRLEDEISGIKKPTNIILFLAIAISIFGLSSLPLIPYIGIGLIFTAFVVCVIVAEYRSYQFLRFYDKQMRKLYKLYDDDAPFDETPPGISPSYVFEHLHHVREQNKKESIKKAAERAAWERKKREDEANSDKK